MQSNSGVDTAATKATQIHSLATGWLTQLGIINDRKADTCDKRYSSARILSRNSLVMCTSPF